MINIAVCDDEIEIAKQVKKYLKSIANELEVIIDVKTYIDVDMLNYDMSENEYFDIIFMDIEIGTDNGITFAEQVKIKKPTTVITFMTGHHNYVFDVFRAHPCGFIRKPIEYMKLKEEFIRALEECKKEEVFEYISNRVVYKIPLKEVVYFNSNGRKITIKMLKEEREFYEKLDNIESKVKSISDDFYRISQSFLVNSDYISSIKYDSLIIKIGNEEKEYKIAQDYRKIIKHSYMNDWEEE